MNIYLKNNFKHFVVIAFIVLVLQLVCLCFPMPPSYLMDDCQCRRTTTTSHWWLWLSTANITVCNLHSCRQSVIRCCCTTSLEQPSSSLTWFWTYSLGVTLVAENTPLLLSTMAP